MNTTKFAKIVSSIGTNPVLVLIWGLVFAYILYSNQSLSEQDHLGILLLGVWTFGIALFFRHKFDLDNKNRNHRTYFLSIFVAGWVTISILYWQFFSEVIHDALKIALITISIILVNNIFYRISFHVCLTVSLLILVNHFTSWSYLILFCIVPVIAWSRIYLKKHTLFQTVAGFLVPVFVYILIILSGILN